MNKKNKWLALAMSAVLAIGALPLVGCSEIPVIGGLFGQGQEQDKVDPPAAVQKVYSVTMQYNGKRIDGGVLSVDLSAGTIQLTADVLKDDGADGTLTFTSSDESVATVDAASGLVTLKASGETIINATAGEKTHSIVLSVSADDTGETYSITVNGGSADVTGARAGDYVVLDVAIPEHKEFVRWNFPESVEWINGNMFRMPEANVEISAEFTDMLYTLNLIGAKVVKANTTENPEFTSGGYSETDASKRTEEYEINVYKLPYDATIDVEAIAEPDGKIFVGWDYGMTNNRMGELGVPEYSFEMPDSTLTVWGIFSTINTKAYTASGISGYTTSSITDGAPSGEIRDNDLEGLNGYRLTFSGHQGAVAGYSNENIMGSQVDTTQEGTQVLKTIVKNHHATQTVQLETYITYYGNIATSGIIEVGPGETKTVYWEAGLGINRPWMGMELRNSLNSSDNVVVDLVCGTAAMYPGGDKSLSTSGKAEFVQLGGYSNVNSKWSGGKPMLINNKLGASFIAIYANNGSGGVYAGGAISSIIQNIPNYDANNTTTSIYGKIINMTNNNNNPVNNMRIVISKNKELTDIVAASEVVVRTTGDVALFKLDIPRTADDGNMYYIGIFKDKIESSQSLYAYNFCMQLTYNNVMGYEG